MNSEKKEEKRVSQYLNKLKGLQQAKKKKTSDREQQAEEEHPASALGWDFINPFLL